MTNTERAVACFVAVVSPLLLAFLFNLPTMNGPTSDWYTKLNKAPWNPPNVVFPIVWSIVYIMIGFASWIIYDKMSVFEGGSVKVPLLWYVGQLLVNFIWNPIFFGLHIVWLSTLHGIALCFLVGWTVYQFYLVNKTAAYLLVPYFVWGIYASTLMFYIWAKN
ncbi:Translocator protein [Halotydeus destructor]|nr:Translocator protein [Halotydeus destructor]